MKKHNLYLTLIIFTIINLKASELKATEVQAGDKDGSEISITVEEIDVNTDNNLSICLGLDFSRINLPWNKEVVCTPMLINGADTLTFTPFSVAGHNRFMWGTRNGQQTPMMFKGWSSKRGELSKQSLAQGADYSLTLCGADQTTYSLTLYTPYLAWMTRATFSIVVLEVGCSSCPDNKQLLDYPMAAIDFNPTNFIADFLFVTPEAEEVKRRKLSGRANVDFQVNKTNILPDYRNNKVELGKITASVDSVKNDKDIEVVSITISGTASPEGPYDNNVFLAKGRTEALKEYVDKLYTFPQDFIQTSYEPVDWKGLVEWLKNNEIDNREEILAIASGTLEPYQRNEKIKNTYPKQYQWLLKNVYPSLRHSDYLIEYTIRNFVNIDEITQVMLSSPEKLSLNEIYLVAKNNPQGSELYNQSFEIAAKIYPEDETANLNAGTLALKKGDYEAADQYLKKAGDKDESKYMKAELEALKGDPEKALKELEQLTENAMNQNIREKAAKAVIALKEQIKKGNKKFTLL